MPNRKAILVFVLLLSSAAFAQTSSAKPAIQPKAADKITAIRAAVLIDGVSAEPRHNVLIVIEGNRD